MFSSLAIFFCFVEGKVVLIGANSNRSCLHIVPLLIWTMKVLLLKIFFSFFLREWMVINV